MVEGPRFVAGLDLHGTLLQPGETVPSDLVHPIAEGLKKLADRVVWKLCTGNDLAFVKDKVPEEILSEIQGHVLETGCSHSPDGKSEEVLTTPAEVSMIKELEGRLKKAGFPEINYFAHRLTSVSMFCDDPRGFHEKVVEHLRETDYFGKLHITYSSVAVDILPAGYDKHRGLELVAKGLPTVGMADSMNDRALLEKADYALAPSNIAPELVPILKSAGRDVVPMKNAEGMTPGVVLTASEPETAGVIEMLEFMDRVIG